MQSLPERSIRRILVKCFIQGIVVLGCFIHWGCASSSAPERPPPATKPVVVDAKREANELEDALARIDENYRLIMDLGSQLLVQQVRIKSLQREEAPTRSSLAKIRASLQEMIEINWSMVKALDQVSADHLQAAKHYDALLLALEEERKSVSATESKLQLRAIESKIRTAEVSSRSHHSYSKILANESQELLSKVLGLENEKRAYDAQLKK